MAEEKERPEKLPVGRLAMRVEGEFWVAYYALPNTMDGAIPLGSLAMFLARQEKYHQRFLDTMASITVDIIEDLTGRRPDYALLDREPKHEPTTGTA